MVDAFFRSTLLLEASSQAAEGGVKIPVTLLLGFLGVVALIYGLAEAFNFVYRKKHGKFVPDQPAQVQADGPAAADGSCETPPVRGGAEQGDPGEPDKETDK